MRATCPRAFARALEPARDGERRAVQDAPDDEGPGRAVPEAAEEHRDASGSAPCARRRRLPPSGM